MRPVFLYRGIKLIQLPLLLLKAAVQQLSSQCLELLGFSLGSLSADHAHPERKRMKLTFPDILYFWQKDYTINMVRQYFDRQISSCC